MIILVENKEDKIALNEIYIYIEDQMEDYKDFGEDYKELNPIYEAKVVNIEKEPQA